MVWSWNSGDFPQREIAERKREQRAIVFMNALKIDLSAYTILKSNPARFIELPPRIDSKPKTVLVIFRLCKTAVYFHDANMSFHPLFLIAIIGCIFLSSCSRESGEETAGNKRESADPPMSNANSIHGSGDRSQSNESNYSVDLSSPVAVSIDQASFSESMFGIFLSVVMGLGLGWASGSSSRSRQRVPIGLPRRLPRAPPTLLPP